MWCILKFERISPVWSLRYVPYCHSPLKRQDIDYTSNTSSAASAQTTMANILWETTPSSACGI
jgi:hypothetical protein